MKSFFLILVIEKKYTSVFLDKTPQNTEGVLQNKTGTDFLTQIVKKHD